MFWWGRVNSVMAIVAFGGSFLCIMSGAWGSLLALWFFVIVLRVCLIVCNVLSTAITGRPLFYDTRIDFERAQEREQVVDDE